jgi:hypothetical protein
MSVRSKLSKTRINASGFEYLFTLLEDLVLAAISLLNVEQMAHLVQVDLAKLFTTPQSFLSSPHGCTGRDLTDKTPLDRVTVYESSSNRQTLE